MRYTVPQSIDPETMDNRVVVRFRVADVYRDKALVVRYDGIEVKRQKQRVMAPGEMEQIVIARDSLAARPGEIVIGVED